MAGLVPYYTRQEIEEGALSGRGLENRLSGRFCRSLHHASSGVWRDPASEWGCASGEFRR